MKKPLFIGADIGGTTVKLAFITHEGHITDKWEITTNRTDNGKYIIKEIAESIHNRAAVLGLTPDQLTAAGVGAPGYIDVENGVIIEAVNLGWKNYGIKSELETLLHIPVIVDNDANLAAGGEKWKGAGEGADNLLAVTLGTGVGGGIIAGGEIIHGESGLAGEIGHITAVKSEGAPCNCGKKGCLETVSSATGIARLGREAAEEYKTGYLNDILTESGTVTAKDVFDGAKKGDETALKVVKESSTHLGFALANLANALNPETIVLGGGVSKAGSILTDNVIEAFKQFSIPKIAAETNINIATLGNDAGVIGAAWLARQKTTSL
ncbi:ROK family glucokinase [Salipaludibacillus aurantiacus]|uniref:Glucokinase n=1 Tax=Salipaludibacillus aurantiacus TaxID=1601833 RepID=A0A1H9R6W0_9BACI|nr:ROK family glucokinase [Salipaludibacillus aurantiacus]SER68462.1 glucokinase [Salipaludibacillus aurantiacus]